MSSEKTTPKRAGVWENLGTSADDGRPPPRRWLRDENVDGAPRRSRLPQMLVAAGTLVLILDVLGVLEPPATVNRWLERWPTVTGALLLMVAFLVVARRYGQALRSVAFYGRFIRPGLKRLLAQQAGRIYGDEKLFRGRKTVIMKIDLADYTRTTFDMPYGMRRLFQDLWFTLIDQVVAEKVFLDKSLGDGSVYCFEDRLPGGSCTAALDAAVEIRERQVERFDAIYRQRLRALLDDTVELALPAEAYLRRFEKRNGRSFWEVRTRVRIALVSGYVDEGLWGLSSQSHYDVHGGPVILASRLEAQARNGEIVFDRVFVEELEEESPGRLDPATLEERHLSLKGIGTRAVYVLPS